MLTELIATLLPFSHHQLEQHERRVVRRFERDHPAATEPVGLGLRGQGKFLYSSVSQYPDMLLLCLEPPDPKTLGEGSATCLNSTPPPFMCLIQYITGLLSRILDSEWSVVVILW